MTWQLLGADLQHIWRYHQGGLFSAIVHQSKGFFNSRTTPRNFSTSIAHVIKMCQPTNAHKRMNHNVATTRHIPGSAQLQQVHTLRHVPFHHCCHCCQCSRSTGWAREYSTQCHASANSTQGTVLHHRCWRKWQGTKFIRVNRLSVYQCQRSCVLSR